MDRSEDDLQNNTNKQSVTIDNVMEKCRICLNSSNLTAMWSIIHKHLTCNDILQSTLSLQLKSSDGFPENICSDCVEEIIKIYKFKQRIEDTERYLHSVLNENMKSGNNLDISDHYAIQGCPYNDHDYFVEYKPPPVPKSVEYKTVEISKPASVEETQRNNEIDDPVKVITEYLMTEKKFKKLPDDLEKGNVICQKCNTNFSNEEELKKHVTKERHFISKQYPCTVCEKRFTKSKLLVHARVHTREQPFTCKICDTKFTIKSNLKRHIMIHTGERPHVCDICGKGFIQGLSLTLHRKTHFHSKERKIRERKLREPNQCVQPTFECDICYRKFKRIIMFQTHLKKHNILTDAVARIQDKSTIARPFKCLICHQSYTSKQYLKLHQRIHGEKKFLCTVCGKGFHQRGSLQTHFRMHTGEKPYKCKCCEKSFAYVSSLEAHTLVHTGQKPHLCTLCGKAFKQTPHLRHHMRVHTGEKPYQCPFCSKCFALKGNLTVHIRTHTGETPYRCEICSKGFYDSSSMKKHRKGHGDVADA